MQRKIFNLLLIGFGTVIVFVGAWWIYGRVTEWMINKNDKLALQRAPVLFNAIETYLVENRGVFPKRRDDLRGLGLTSDVPFCGEKKDGFMYDCTFGIQGYELRVYPVKKDKTGRAVIQRSKSNTIYIEHPPQDPKIIKRSTRGYLQETDHDYKKTLLPDSNAR